MLPDHPEITSRKAENALQILRIGRERKTLNTRLSVAPDVDEAVTGKPQRQVRTRLCLNQILLLQGIADSQGELLSVSLHDDVSADGIDRQHRILGARGNGGQG